jgi:hypothetical protein
LASIKTVDEEKGVSIQVLKTLGGDVLHGELLISDFYLLELCSSSGHGVEFHMPQVDSCYFLLSRNKEGKYCIATPTTGFDYVSEGKVAATFRHSYHKALLPVDVYEKTMTALFRHYHNQPFDKTYINSFIKEQLAKKPASLEMADRENFFLQHAALESIYHLKLATQENLLLPFLNDKHNFHNQISGARAMVTNNTPQGKQALLHVLQDTTSDIFAQVICIRTLQTFNPKEMKTQLQQLQVKASEESNGFGGNIMDPRVCTFVPSVKEALTELISKL